MNRDQIEAKALEVFNSIAADFSATWHNAIHRIIGLEISTEWQSASATVALTNNDGQEKLVRLKIGFDDKRYEVSAT